METFKLYKIYKNFSIYKKGTTKEKFFFGFKLDSKKKKYEFRTKDYKTLKSVEKSIDNYLFNIQ